MSTARADHGFDSLSALDDILASGDAPLSAFRSALEGGSVALRERFADGESISALVQARALLVDALLVRAWRRFFASDIPGPALVAVGGYGRGELLPGSDIDVSVLLPTAEIEAWRERLEDFLAFIWDIGLEVGHSMRTVDDCAREAGADVTVTTSLMEARLLCGPATLFDQMRTAIAPEAMWSARAFFEAKLAEQRERHRRYHDTAHNLEPDVKSSPGGLRDIQMIGWVAQRHFGAADFEELVQHGFLTRPECDSLLAGRDFLWRIRFALHALTGRREDRLLFEHQVRIAEMFGYEDASYTLAVEQLMQRYYRTVLELNRLNEMLLQLFREAILTDTPPTPLSINDRFRARGAYLETCDDEVFARHPAALLELFLMMQEHPDLAGVSAHTIRLVRRYRHLIDEEFRQNPRHHRMFVRLLRGSSGVTRELRRMNRYGILGRYIPAFGRIVGRMQYDLFHAYTVDAHTLFVVGNLRRFARGQPQREFPWCSEIMQALPKPEIVYLAALFHDIAKGRGGDHSSLGAVDAEAFCLEQGLNRYDARLVAWLVQHHLDFSATAQKKDISDPGVIHAFARRVGDEIHLDHLYVLTVADVRATNPKLWNSWKASLFEQLYAQTRRALRRGLENPIDKDELIAETQADARALLEAHGVDPTRIDAQWARFHDEYFLRHSSDEIAWHGRLLAEHEPREDGSLVAIRQQTEAGGTAIFLSTRHARPNFALVTGVLDQLGLNVLDARIAATRDSYTLDTYVVLEASGAAIDDDARLVEIEAALRGALLSGATARVSRRAPRQTRMFSTSTELEFTTDRENRRTVIELIAGDRPGILSDIGRVFRDEGIDVQGAKITTVGERAEDVFYVTDDQGQPLEHPARERLARRLAATLDYRGNKE